MQPSREKTLERALGTSGGVSGGVLGLQGPLLLSDRAGGTAEPGQLPEGEPLPLLSLLCFSSACSNVSDSYFVTLHGGHRTEAALCLMPHGLSNHALCPVQPYLVFCSHGQR